MHFLLILIIGILIGYALGWLHMIWLYITGNLGVK